MSDLRELYQEVILDHSKRPRNFRALPEANHRADGYNPLCGDKATIFLQMEDGVVRDASFQGAGCSISTASASMMTEALKGKTRAQADALFERFHRLITSDPSRASENTAPELGKLAAFSGDCEGHHPVLRILGAELVGDIALGPHDHRGSRARQGGAESAIREIGTQLGEMRGFRGSVRLVEAVVVARGEQARIA